MLVQKAQNAASTKLTVTSTATSLFDLMNTAGGTDLDRAGFRPGINGVDIKIETGDIRYLDDGNTPTASNGVLGVSGVCSFRCCSSAASLLAAPSTRARRWLSPSAAVDGKPTLRQVQTLRQLQNVQLHHVRKRPSSK